MNKAEQETLERKTELMNRLHLLFCLALGLVVTQINARPMLWGDDSVTSCFPNNELRFPSHRKSMGLTLFDLHSVVEDFSRVMGPKIKKNYGLKLLIEKDWDNDRVNAHATRDSRNNPVIRINGGLVRHPMMTRDALVAILCHELGHQFGGAPKQLRGRSELRSWSSAEGQADYYAATKCMPFLFGNEGSGKSLTEVIDDKTFEKLEQVCDDSICKRAALAALQMTRLFASLRMGIPEPSLLSNDESQVYLTDLGHPAPQCRLDTMISGLYCERAREARFDDQNPLKGTCLGMPGGRPSCWFHPENF